MKRILKIAAAIVLLLVVLGAGALWLSPPVIEIPAPTGPNGVGYAERVLVDDARGRPVSLDIWYPTSPGANGPREPYTDRALAVQLQQEQGIPDLGDVKLSHSVRDAPALEGVFPTVIFNHGFGSFSKQNFSNFEHLASHGVIVISLAHPRESLVSRDAAGQLLAYNPTIPAIARMKQIASDPEYPARLERILEALRGAGSDEAFDVATAALSADAQFVALRSLLDAWVADTRFVAGRLGPEATDPLLKKANSERLVIAGHSLGGIVAMELGRTPPPGVAGVVNLDGPLLRSSTNAALAPVVQVFTLLSTVNRLRDHGLSTRGMWSRIAPKLAPGSSVIEPAGRSLMKDSDPRWVPLLNLPGVLGPADATTFETQLNGEWLAFVEQITRPSPP